MTKRYRLGDRLRQCSLFVGCPRRQLALADGLFTHIRFPAGRHLIREGERGHEMFVVRAGEVAVRRGLTEVARLGPGAVVGELALLDGAARNADVVAVGSVDVLVQGTGEFEAMRDLAPALVARVKEVAHRRRSALGSGGS